EALLGKFETDPGASGGFDKKVDHGLAAQRRNLFDGPLTDGLEGTGGVEDRHDFLDAKRFDSQQMLAIPAHGLSKTTSSARPASSKITCTISAREVGRFLPTKSALIGNSRWPRSTRTANWMRLGRPKSLRASMAARAVRPLKSTSSTRTTVLLVMSNGITVGWTSGAMRLSRSSRCMLTSSLPVGAGWLQMPVNTRLSRSAKGTPPRCMPTSTTSWLASFRSAIS